ncbi:sensor histidine kinase [Arthrobacter sp. Z1-15]
MIISLVCFVLGAAIFLVLFGVELEERGDTTPDSLILIVFFEALIGMTAAIAAGPVRTSRVGNILLVAAAVFSTWALPAWIFAAVRLGSRRSLPLDISVITITALGAGGYTWLRETLVPGTPTSGFDYLLIMMIAAVGAGLAVLWGRVRGTRAALVIALREQAASAEAAHHAVLQARHAEITRTRIEERSAIARDMHDGISHQLAIVAMHSGALAYRADLTKEQQRSAASTVRDAAANASSMLRDALTALRSLEDPHAASPLPDATFIQQLVEAAHQEGRQVELTWVNMTAGDLDQTTGRTATLGRILEELLLNAQKYAPGAPMSVQIEKVASTTVLRVSNPLVDRPSHPPPPVGTGLGLIGVAERAELLGGTAFFGPTHAGTFDVEVVLP